MSRLSSARAGIPSIGQKSKFRRFRRKRWMVGGAAREAYFTALNRDPDARATGLSRTWREGEPLIVTKYRSVRGIA